MSNQLENSMPMQDINEVLSGLNKEQYKAATSSSLNIRVVAGPGTGKTKTMEARVANLLSGGVEPNGILALSFTNESSKEFKDRVQDTCGLLGHKIKTGTFHGIFNRFLRKYSSHEFFKTKLGYPEGFFIIDDDDSKKIMKESIKSLPNGFKKLIDKLELKPRDFTSQMSLLRAKCHTPSTFFKITVKDDDLYKEWLDISSSLNSTDDADSVNQAYSTISQNYKLRDFLLIKVWDKYAKNCRAVHAIDFDDVLTNTYYLLKFNPSLCKKIASEFNHILIDEYQDTNYIQAAIIKELKRGNPKLNLFIVGDGRQAIYDFRGSDVLLMTNAQNDYGIFEDHELKVNYRSSQNLITSTNIFAVDMQNQITKGQLECGIDTINNQMSEYHKFDSDFDEANWVVDEIKRNISIGEKAEDIYVIYRTRTAAKKIEDVLKQSHMPFEMVGERNFYECAEVRDVMAFLRSIVRPKDVLAWSRITDVMPIAVTGMWIRDQYQKNHESTPIELLKGRAKGKNLEPINEVLEFHQMSYDLLRLEETKLIEEFILDDGGNITIDAAKQFIATSDEARKAYASWKAEFWLEVTEGIRDAYIQKTLPAYEKIDALKAKTTGNENESATDKRLDNIAILFDEIRIRLNSEQSLFDIVDDLTTRDSKQRESGVNGVKLLTGHASKGLEAKVCFIVGCDNAIWKRGLDPLTAKELDEAARLYYVMATRSKVKNYLTTSSSRFMFDKTVKSAPFPMIAQHIADSISAGVMITEEHGKSLFQSDFSSQTTSQSSNSTLNVIAPSGANKTTTSKLGSRLKESFKRTENKAQTQMSTFNP
ncbi:MULTISPECIES: ATP-dependent helicase [Vibrio]|uniref:ATP-dependent helicase n=1 Tax=Vibrio TaxID=662 RepID=UPI001482C214|nr:ATP-dependent helicase [Vibrio tasmaniensis]